MEIGKKINFSEWLELNQFVRENIIDKETEVILLAFVNVNKYMQ